MSDQIDRTRDRAVIRRHRQGIPVAHICDEFAVSHTVLYRILGRNDAERRIDPWTAQEDAVILADPDATAQDLADRLIGRSRQAVKWRRSQLRKRGDLPPYR